jgi:CHU_C Type IX secretion signal domain
MKIKITQIFKKHFFIQLIIVLFASNSLFSQFIEAPSYGATALLCAYEITPGPPPINFNTFQFKFKFNGFGAGANFSLEMSDANGSFANATIRDTQFFSVSPAILTLTVPSNFVGGNGFKFRVKSGSVISDVEKNPSNLLIDRLYEIHFILYKNSFTINNNNSTATICGNFGITLSVDNPLIPPASLTSLRYNWYKDSSTTPIIGQTGSSFLVLTSGVYYAKIDYGLCSNSVYNSQPVTVNFSTSSGNYIITSSIGNVVETGVPTVLSTPLISGNTYKWYRDGVLIPLATSNSLSTDQVGVYYLEITDSTCVNQSNKITLKNPFVLPLGTVVPNIVSPNNDGNNDSWVLPDEYIIGTGTNIQILDSKGQIAFTSDNYLNDWPQTTLDFESINPVYYYIITPANGIIKKGSITVLK